ncbi:MAG: Ig-like domain-containing protein, partial [Candidatus Rifleibacteriota bacterium]
MKKCLFILTIIGCTLSLFNLSGCNFLGNSDSQTVFPTGNSETDASLKLNVVLPESEDNLPGNAAIRGATTPSVKVILNIRQPGSETNKVQTLIKNFTVMSSAAEITFSNLPTGLIIAKMQIENGHIQGWKSLHGATDLVSGDNELDISPAGSKLKADLLASALQNAIENDKLMAAGGSTMATNLANALTTVDTDSVNPYNSVLNLLIDQINPTGIVKVEFDNNADTLTAFDGATQLWQKSYTATEILGTTPIAGIETTAFQAVRIVQQGFGDYFAIEWRDPSSLVSLITTHNPSDGQGKNFFINQGIFDQILAISDSEYVIGGFNASEKAPGIWKWNINKTGIVRSLAETSTNLDLEVYFSEIAYSAISTSGNVIENLMYDGQGNINAVIKTEDGESKTYLISLSDGSKTDITPSTSSNALPVVSITSPSDGASVEVNNSLTISASASDSDGTISKVEFYAGSTLLGSDQSDPYS